MCRDLETITSHSPPCNGHHEELPQGCNTRTIYKAGIVIPQPAHGTNGTADHDTISTLQQQRQPNWSTNQCQLKIIENGNRMDGQHIQYTRGLQDLDN